MKTHGVVLLLIAKVFSASVALAATCPATQRVHFEKSFETQYGQSVFVLGDIKQLGGNDMRYAVKLDPSQYPNWKLDMQLPAGTRFSYRYVVRSDQVRDVSRGDNGSPISDVIQISASTPEKFPTQVARQKFSNGSRRDYNPANPPRINSRVLNQSRSYRVVLPPDYDLNSNERYPVIYAHDGQNMFDRGSNGSWNAIEAMDREVGAGRMKKVIIVGIDNNAQRFENYIPADDDGGRADRYVKFIRDELKPFIDKSYRTLSDAKNTGTLGSSLGGLVSMYMAWDHSDVFGRIGVFSGSFQMENFTNRVKNSARPENVRLYMDTGESGTANDGFYNSRGVYDSLIGRDNPFVLEGNMRFVIGFGQSHNESAWAARLPGALSFLYPACE